MAPASFDESARSDQAAPRRWTGGVNLPTLHASRITLSEPFGVLTVDDQVVELRVGGRLLARLTHAETLRVRPPELKSVFAIRSRSFRGFRGVGFRRHDGREYYFKTAAAGGIVAELQARGFTVSPAEDRVAKIWRLDP